MHQLLLLDRNARWWWQRQQDVAFIRHLLKDSADVAVALEGFGRGQVQEAAGPKPALEMDEECDGWRAQPVVNQQAVDQEATLAGVANLVPVRILRLDIRSFQLEGG